jgi:2-polyprenyl-3-methyl-5-hydroxy-6-metoxy-1,4-benzoquinol methylase
VSYVNLLGIEWLPAIPDVHARLQADPPARVADFGCGGGWSSIAIARAYPNVTVDGFDLEEPRVELARTNARAAGVEDRVRFHVQDVSRGDFGGTYDLVTGFEMLHDAGRPVDVLRSMRRLAGPSGAIIVMDERVGEEFAAPGDMLEQFFYGASVLYCLPAGLGDTPSAGTGAVMRPATLRKYASEAGFRDVEILDIPHDMWRFYRLRQ